MLDKQINIYSVDTSAFYHDDEKEIHSKLNKLYEIRNFLNIEKNRVNNMLGKMRKELKKNKKDESMEDFQEIKKYILYKIEKNEETMANIKLENSGFIKTMDKKIELFDFDDIEKENIISKVDENIAVINKIIGLNKNELYILFKQNKTKQRYLDNTYINESNIISVFESTLTRVMELEENKLYDDLIIVQTYFFDVIEDIILDGFIHNGERYKCLTASAGQIRTKKTVFIKEKLWDLGENTITCGLTTDIINKCGGININKYLAYLALSNSATDLWQDFNIEKAIVVEDFETLVTSTVDFIDDEDYSILRKDMNVPIPHTDGCGMILPSLFDKAFMTRIPWVKGLLVPFPFDMFIKEKSEESGTYCGIIKDIYGKEYDILKDDIQIIFTKSQFKMWKYYKSIGDEDGELIKTGWEVYKDNFKKYNCQAGRCNIEEDRIRNAKINYQMMQTLTDITDDELKKLCEKTNEDILKIGSDKKIMMNVLGVSKYNTNKNYFQQALEIYPELLQDTYSKEILKKVKKSLVKNGRSAKIKIKGKYTFLSPDLYAFCEYLFLGEENPKGLLEDGQVCCNMFDSNKELDCLRSPHLYREHAIRVNIKNVKTNKWFVTKSIYTSCHDVISKILQFDVDGDKGLICDDETLVEVAKRNMKGVVPLYYNMRKADAMKIDSNTIYNGLKMAYTGGNIGEISNNISKIWNSGDIDLNAIKLLCMENNFTIDYAKTLYKPTRPDDKKQLITSYTKAKVPHFFIHAKDKEKDKVESINNSTVNRLGKIIKDKNIVFSKIEGLKRFEYKNLMHDKKYETCEEDKKIIEKYTELDLKVHFMIDRNDNKYNNQLHIYNEIKKEILSINRYEKYIVDVLVRYLYSEKKSSSKVTLWECFGDIIVENLIHNLTKDFKKKAIHCAECGILIEKINNKIKYCEECAKKIQQNQKNKWKNKNGRKIENPENY